jgi:hypothetical protein
MNRLTQWLFDKPRATQGDVFAALDVGTSKIACFIARLDEMGQPNVIGIGHQSSEGVRAGLVADMDAVQRSVSAAVGDGGTNGGRNHRPRYRERRGTAASFPNGRRFPTSQRA